MKIFGFGDITGVYNFLKSKIFEYKQNDEEEVLFFEEEINSPAVPAESPAIASFKSEPAEDEEQVIYVKWPLRAEMFMEVKAGSDVELKNGGLWAPGEMNEATPVDEMDVLHIPDVVNVPVLSPVMQDEKIMNVDILTSRGIFIGLAPVDMEWLVRSAPEEFLDLSTIDPKIVEALKKPESQEETEQKKLVSFETSKLADMQNASNDENTEDHKDNVQEIGGNSIFAFESETTDGQFADPENTSLASDPDLNLEPKPEKDKTSGKSKSPSGYFDILKKSSKKK